MAFDVQALKRMTKRDNMNNAVFFNYFSSFYSLCNKLIHSLTYLSATLRYFFPNFPHTMKFKSNRCIATIFVCCNTLEGHTTMSNAPLEFPPLLGESKVLIK